jgi:AcrR family transcriptional regulator
MSPRPQIEHIRRPQFVEAAASVIAERGLAATRLADIAERLGTSPAAVLYWFDSKEELLSEALSYEEERFRVELAELLEADATPSERLDRLILASVGEPSSGASDWRLWMELWTRALREPEAAGTRAELDRAWRGEIAAIIADGQRSGEFGGGMPDDVAAELAALLDGLAVQNTLRDAEMPDERMLEIARRAAERMLAR